MGNNNGKDNQPRSISAFELGGGVTESAGKEIDVTKSSITTEFSAL